MEEQYTLEEMQQYCSEYIVQHYGKQMDTTPWWDKWRIIGTFRVLKQEEKKDEQVYYFRQNE